MVLRLEHTIEHMMVVTALLVAVRVGLAGDEPAKHVEILIVVGGGVHDLVREERSRKEPREGVQRRANQVRGRGREAFDGRGALRIPITTHAPPFVTL